MRQPNHTYSFSGTWVGEAGQSYYTHGLWQAVDGNYRFVDILDEEIALRERSSPPGEVTGERACLNPEKAIRQALNLFPLWRRLRRKMVGLLR